MSTFVAMACLRLFVCFYLWALVTSQDIKVKCQEYYDFPPSSENSPSLLADLKVELVKISGNHMINVSWAINIDASVKYLMGTRISGTQVHLCQYFPPLAQSNISRTHQKWFHYVLNEGYGSTLQAANLPLPPLGSGPSYKLAKMLTAPPAQSVEPKPTKFPTAEISEMATQKPLTDPNKNSSSIYLGLAALMVLTCGYVTYKRCGTKLATSAAFKRLATSARVPTPVLLVYPPENEAFQKAVTALAEFLQERAGCHVAMDLWQQGAIAHLGPLHWLAQQVEAAHHVLIVYRPSSRSPFIKAMGGSAAPAAPHDLYPLILNTVASHAKSSGQLAKFWVLRLGCLQDGSFAGLPPELRACKMFCLLKDLDKLCRGLHAQRADGPMKWTHVLVPRVNHHRCRSMLKLRDSIDKLSGCLLSSEEAVALDSPIIFV